MDLGLRMAMTAVGAALADLPHLVGLRITTNGGRRAAALRPEASLEPGFAMGDGPGNLVWQEYREGPGGAMQLHGSPQTLGKAAAEGRLAKAVAAGARSEAALIVSTRTGTTVFEFSRSGVRRYSLPSGQAAGVFSDLPAPAPRSRAQARSDTTAASQSQSAPGQEPQPERADSPPHYTGEEQRPVPREIRDILDPSRAAPLLEAIGLLTPAGQIRRDERRKFGQIVHLVGLVAGALAALPRERTLTVVDCACGKSQLLFVLNHVMTEGLGLRAHFVGLDVSEQAVATARGLQARLGYINMRFAATLIRTWDPPERLDLVLSLHACDTATDEAIALGIAARSPVVIAVPCCQAELARQVKGEGEGLERVFAHGVLRRRFGDWVTDALRVLYLEANGYDVDVLEYVSPLDTPKNTMLRAKRVPSRPKARDAAAQAFATICDRYGLDPSLPRLREMLETRMKLLE